MIRLLTAVLLLSSCGQPPRPLMISRTTVENAARIFGVSAPPGYVIRAIYITPGTRWFACTPLDSVSMPHVFVINVLSNRDVVISDCTPSE